MPGKPVDLIDLRRDVDDREQRRILCDAFYSQVYRLAFTKPDQTETPATWLPLLNEDQPPPHPLLHIVVARAAQPSGAEPQILGGGVFEYFRQSRAALITYIAVHPDARRMGLARQMLARVFVETRRDNGGTMPLVLAEVENPDAQTSPDDRRIATERIGIFRALGGARIDFGYVQPPLSPNQKAISDLHLIVLSPDAIPASFPATQIRTFLTEFFGSLNQAGSQGLRTMLQNLPAPDIATRKL
jgi:GNAT superfamily N-acetyltransferase